MDAGQASSFLSFSPVMERVSEAALATIVDVDATFAGAAKASAKDHADAVLARAKAHIMRGDLAYARGAYEAALASYKAARALLYRQVHPKFDALGWAASSSVLLPVSERLETAFLTTASRFLDAARPSAPATAFLSAPGTDTVPRDLSDFASSGFQPGRDGGASELLRQSAAFLEDGRPCEAVALIEGAGDLPRRTSVGDRAALLLNLATARIQIGDDARGSEAASEARDLFRRARDTQGQALALHAGAVALREIDAAQSQRLGGEAAELARPLLGEAGREDDLEALDRGLKAGRPLSLARAIASRRGDVLPVRAGSGAVSRMIELADAKTSDAAQWTVEARGAGGPVAFEHSAQSGIAATAIAEKLYDVRIVAAKAQYAKLVSEEFTAPATLLYADAKLEHPADIARAAVDALGTGPAVSANAEIAWHVLIAAARMQAILDGLDFYGTLLSPIHTFEYLQGVARGFAQGAIQAEREFVNFTTQQEAETATRRELETMLAMAVAEALAKVEAAKAAHDDLASAQAAVDLAVERRNNAQAQRDDYASVSWQQIWATAAAQALGGGQSALVAIVTALADRLDAGETISGQGPLLAAAVTFSAGRKTRKYEIAKMAWVMRGISSSYLDDAIRIAKLMQRAFNFENDTTVSLIKNAYGHAMVNATTGGSVTLLGGDSLLRDIESFTFQAITGRTRKNSRIKDTISIARNFPAQFEQFRRTGVLELETDLYEFDRLHPGFHNQRIEAVEVEFAGLLPPEGLNGIIRCGGVTGYRTRSRGHNKRVHQVDTMALSDFALRNDLFVYTPEVGLKGLFQGMGLATTWKVHLPRRSNDFDYARIFDINLVLYYTAQFDPLLRKVVLAAPVRPGELSELRNFDLRFDFPESWFTLYRTASATFRLGRERLPFNQQDFGIESLTLRVVTKAGVSAAGITLALTAPGGASGTATTDALGSVSTDDPALQALAAGSPVGEWSIAVTGGASLMNGGELKTDRIHNIQFGLEYEFEFVPEEI